MLSGYLSNESEIITKWGRGHKSSLDTEPVYGEGTHKGPKLIAVLTFGAI